MNKQAINAIVQNIKGEITKKTPEILTAFGITGMITSTVLAVKATPKAIDILNEIKAEGHKDKKEEAKEIITRVVPCYIPSILTTCVSTACLIGSVNVNTRRTTALATAYSLVEGNYRDYKDKVTEMIGEKKEKEIEAAIAQDKIDKNPPAANEIDVTKGGKTLFYDPVVDKYFESSIETVKGVINKLNYRLRQEMYISYNDMRHELGLKSTSNGDDFGWNIDCGEIEPNWSAQIVTEEGLYQGQPCLVLQWYVGPRYDFRTLM